MSRIYLILLIFVSFACKQDYKSKPQVNDLPYYNEASFTPIWLSSNDDSIAKLHQIPSFNLINQNGDTVTEQTFKNKIYVTDFFFTICPGICPKMTANLSLIQDAFLNDDEVLLLSHSVTPTRDSIEKLKLYADEKGVNSKKWHLVTGDRDEIYNLGRKQYFVEENLGLQKDTDEFLHTENFVLIDKNKHIRGIYNGLNKTDVKQLIADIHTLKKEG